MTKGICTRPWKGWVGWSALVGSETECLFVEIFCSSEVVQAAIFPPNLFGKISNLQRSCHVSTRNIRIPFPGFTILNILPCLPDLFIHMISLNHSRISYSLYALYLLQHVFPKNKDVLLQNHSILITLRKINVTTILLSTILIHFSLLGPRMFFIAGVSFRGQISPTAYVRKWSFLGTQPLSVTYVLFMAVFMLQLQRRVVGREIACPAKPKLFSYLTF